VVYGEVEYSDDGEDAISNPKIVVEVLSPTTKNNDLGPKLRLYWDVASLTDILLIDQETVWIEYWFRTPGGEWKNCTLESLQERLMIESAGCEIPVAEIYAGVEFSA